MNEIISRPNSLESYYLCFADGTLRQKYLTIIQHMELVITPPSPPNFSVLFLKGAF